MRLLRSLRRFAMVAALSIVGSSAFAAEVAAPAAVALQRQMVADPFANTDAMSVLVPEGWKMQGHVNWDFRRVDYCQMDIAVFDPASGSGIVFYPDATFYDGVRESYVQQMAPVMGVASAMKNAQAQFPDGTRKGIGQTAEIRKLPASPADYVHDFLLPRVRRDIDGAKDLKLIEVIDLPKYAQARIAQLAANGVDPAGATCTASAIRCSYTSPEGLAVQEQFVCVLLALPTVVKGDPFRAWVAEVVSMRAPADHFDAALPLLNTIQCSRERQPQWFSFCLAINDEVLKNQQAITATIMDNTNRTLQNMRDSARRVSADTSDRIRAKFADQQKVKAQASENYLNYVKGEQQYNLPGGSGRVTLPAGYKFNYLSTGGRIVSTNDPTYRPPADPKTSWEQLQPR